MALSFKTPQELAKKYEDEDLAWKLTEYLDNEPEIDENAQIDEVLRPYIAPDKLNVSIDDAVRAFVGKSGLTGTNTWADWLKYNYLQK